MSPIASYVLQTAITLLGVVLLAWLILYATRRIGTGTDNGPMRLVGRLPLEGRRAVYLVRVADRFLILGSSEAGISKLAELESVPEAFLNPPPKRSFKDVLTQHQGKAPSSTPLPPLSDKQEVQAEPGQTETHGV